MSKNTIVVLICHHHKLLDLIYKNKMIYTCHEPEDHNINHHDSEISNFKTKMLHFVSEKCGKSSLILASCKAMVMLDQTRKLSDD
jgi:hypothetical protein